MPLRFNAQELVAQLRQVVWMMRRGQREVTLATAALGLFAAGTWLLTGPNLGPVPTSSVAYGCYVMGAVLLVWVGYRLWQQAVPSPLPPPEPRPSAVKGPMAFGPEDGTLFQRLGRDHELAQLLSLTLNDQIPLIVVMGESGVGKTSLLRAGLSYILQSQNVQYGVPGVTAGKFTVSHNCLVIKWLRWPINRCDAAGFAVQYGDIPLSV
jgi:hypothetical protein